MTGALHAVRARSNALARNHAPTVSGDRLAVIFLPKITRSWCRKGLSLANLPCGVGVITGGFTRYLRELQKQAHNSKRAAGTKRPRDFAFTPEDDENEGNANNVWASSEVGGRADESLASPASDFTLNIWTSPFALPSTVIKDTHTEQRNWSSLTCRSFSCFLSV